MQNKAQGLPMNTLVLGALALLVLIGIAAVWIGGGGQIFSSFGNLQVKQK